MPAIKLNVSARGIHSQMRKYLRQEVSRISGEMLDEIAERAQDFALEQYGNAEYAGVDPGPEIWVDAEKTGPLSYEIKPIGDPDFIKWVEYGTGVYNSKSKKQRWWFYDDGRAIVHNDYAEPAKPRYRTGEYEDVYDAKGNPTGKREWSRYPKPVKEERDGVWFTHGSPANMVMAKTKQKVISEIVPEVVKEHGGKHYD